MLPRLLPAGFVIPAQPVPAPKPPTDPKWDLINPAGRSEGTPLHPKCDRHDREAYGHCRRRVSQEAKRLNLQGENPSQLKAAYHWPPYALKGGERLTRKLIMYMRRFTSLMIELILWSVR
jgi:hypothetical protein